MKDMGTKGRGDVEQWDRGVLGYGETGPWDVEKWGMGV